MRRRAPGYGTEYALLPDNEDPDEEQPRRRHLWVIWLCLYMLVAGVVIAIVLYCFSSVRPLGAVRGACCLGPDVAEGDACIDHALAAECAARAENATFHADVLCSAAPCANGTAATGTHCCAFAEDDSCSAHGLDSEEACEAVNGTFSERGDCNASTGACAPRRSPCCTGVRTFCIVRPETECLAMVNGVVLSRGGECPPDACRVACCCPEACYDANNTVTIADCNSGNTCADAELGVASGYGETCASETFECASPPAPTAPPPTPPPTSKTPPPSAPTSSPPTPPPTAASCSCVDVVTATVVLATTGCLVTDPGGDDRLTLRATVNCTDARPIGCPNTIVLLTIAVAMQPGNAFAGLDTPYTNASIAGCITSSDTIECALSTTAQTSALIVIDFATLVVDGTPLLATVSKFEHGITGCQGETFFPPAVSAVCPDAAPPTPAPTAASLGACCLVTTDPTVCMEHISEAQCDAVVDDLTDVISAVYSPDSLCADVCTGPNRGTCCANIGNSIDTCSINLDESDCGILLGTFVASGTCNAGTGICETPPVFGACCLEFEEGITCVSHIEDTTCNEGLPAALPALLSSSFDGDSTTCSLSFCIDETVALGCCDNIGGTDGVGCARANATTCARLGGSHNNLICLGTTGVCTDT